jgi:hypothetical protein
MAKPGSDAAPNMPAAVALAVCIARTLHQRDGRFLEALRTEIEAMQAEFAGDSEAGKALYQFGLAVESDKLFPKG